MPGAFESDLAFLRQNTELIVLAEPGGTAQVVVAPEYQGRVMTSTTGGRDAPSFGWIGRATIAARAKQPHINVFGGEDRFWLGPEGGQYSLYFKKGDPFDLDHWQVPEAFDWGKWDAESQTPTSVRFRKRMSLVNYSGTPFDIEVERTVRLLPTAEFEKHFGVAPAPAVRMVAFESANTVRNAGGVAWSPASGLVSVWILGMFTPSPETTIAIPFEPGPEATLGAIVNDTYFGKVPDDRLRVKEPVIFFRGDGQYRSKIGLSPARARSVAGSYDRQRQVLTLVQYTRPANATRYVNSMWEIQREPYKGDVVNSYNDGPPEPGKPPLGPFYELETSSPALSLAPGETFTHLHRTVHLLGREPELDAIARATLGVGLADMAGAFNN
ncbi:MAG: hypothetical protein EHM55_02780 [Acidobacteria bacterium]|nr:MAG: hypothetical protein EHM55_02780 [Acidobacteriota bacterium]